MKSIFSAVAVDQFPRIGSETDGKSNLIVTKTTPVRNMVFL